MTIQTDMDSFITYGGQTAFAFNISNALFIDVQRIKVTSVKKGSVIIEYKIIESQKDNLDQLNSLLGQIIEYGMVEVGGPISSYGKIGEEMKQPQAYVAVPLEENLETGSTLILETMSSGKGVVLIAVFLVICGCIIFYKKFKSRPSEPLASVNQTSFDEIEVNTQRKLDQMGEYPSTYPPQI